MTGDARKLWILMCMCLMLLKLIGAQGDDVSTETVEIVTECKNMRGDNPRMCWRVGVSTEVTSTANLEEMTVADVQEATTAVAVGVAETTAAADSPPPVEPGQPPVRVTTILVPPYVMERSEETDNITSGDLHSNHGHGDYVGFLVDLLDAIMSQLGRPYNLTLVKDGEYGAEQGGSWTGMIGEVYRKEVNLAVAPLSVTSERQRVVDFTTPFERFDTVAVFQQRQWNHPEPVQSLEDLLEYGFRFGVTENSTAARTLEAKSEMALFADSHRSLWERIQNNTETGLMPSNSQGIKKARRVRDYAFLIDGSVARWVLQQEPCDLDYVTTQVRHGQYAMVVGHDDSAFRDDIDIAMYELQHSGAVQQLRDKWWPDQCAGTALHASAALAGLLGTLALLLQPH